MGAENQPARDFLLGAWLVQPTHNRLRRGDECRCLEPKVMDVLVCLLSRADRVVRKEEIIDAVWAKRFIAESSLSRAIALLRRALDDDAGRPRYIETIARRGYQIVAPVRILDTPGLPLGCALYTLVAGAREFALAEGENLIGRATDSPVCIDSPSVSRRHARIVICDGRITLEDLGSHNGTFVDGQRLAVPATLSDGDRFVIGSTELVFHMAWSAGSTESDRESNDENHRSP